MVHHLADAIDAFAATNDQINDQIVKAFVEDPDGKKDGPLVKEALKAV